MSNYTPQIAWAAKNALADSDSAKIVSGADFHTEFSAVQTAVNTKLDPSNNLSDVTNGSTSLSNLGGVGVGLTLSLGG